MEVFSISNLSREQQHRILSGQKIESFLDLRNFCDQTEYLDVVMRLINIYQGAKFSWIEALEISSHPSFHTDYPMLCSLLPHINNIKDIPEELNQRLTPFQKERILELLNRT